MLFTLSLLAQNGYHVYTSTAAPEIAVASADGNPANSNLRDKTRNASRTVAAGVRTAQSSRRHLLSPVDVNGHEHVHVTCMWMCVCNNFCVYVLCVYL